MQGRPYDGSPLGYYRRVTVGKAGEKMPPARFQAGGVVSSLITFALTAGRIDAALLTDREGLIPTVRVAARPDEVVKSATSTYTAAPTVSALYQGIEAGCSRMGVVGTPCQIAAVAQFRANPMKRPGFTDPVNLTIGLFCTWALDTRRLISLLSDRIDCRSIVKMDVPPPPAEIFEIETRGGRTEIPLDEIRSLIPEGCTVCPDMTSEWTDISVGNLEGEPGWNTILIRTEKGDALIADAVDAGWLVIREMPQQNLAHLTSAAANKKKRAIRKAGAEGFLNTSAEGAHSAMRISPGVVDHIIGTKED